MKKNQLILYFVFILVFFCLFLLSFFSLFFVLFTIIFLQMYLLTLWISEFFLSRIMTRTGAGQGASTVVGSVQIIQEPGPWKPQDLWALNTQGPGYLVLLVYPTPVFRILNLHILTLDLVRSSFYVQLYKGFSRG